jgi:ribosomal protein L16/L10AE
MPPIKVQLSEETERKFREAAMRRFGYVKGALSLAAEKALSSWVRKEREVDRLVAGIGDPVGAIEGLLAHVKSGSVELQHEATSIRARRALDHASHRR